MRVWLNKPLNIIQKWKVTTIYYFFFWSYCYNLLSVLVKSRNNIKTILAINWTSQCFLFLSAQQVKELLKPVNNLWVSLLIVSAQWIIWNRNLAHVSPHNSFRQFCPYFLTNTRTRVWQNECKCPRYQFRKTSLPVNVLTKGWTLVSWFHQKQIVKNLIW